MKNKSKTPGNAKGVAQPTSEAPLAATTGYAAGVKPEMRPTTEPREVKAALTEMKAGKKDKKLIFDTATGELIIGAQNSEVNRDNVVIDQIYETGFFAKAA